MPTQNRVVLDRPGNNPTMVTSVDDVDLSRCGGNTSDPVRDLEWIVLRVPKFDTPARRKAALIYTRGAAADLIPCERCERGQGPFHKCVVAWDENGYIANGNCANCYWHHKTSSCSRRDILPCQALAEIGADLGDFEEACRIHCGGAHIPESDGEYGMSSDHEAEEGTSIEEDDDAAGETTSEVSDAGDDDSEDGYDEDVSIKKRNIDYTPEQEPSTPKKTRGFMAVNCRRL